MRQAAEEKTSLLPDPTVYKLWDNDFIKNVEMEVLKLDPVCIFIDTVQSKSCTFAESTHAWLQMDFVLGYHSKWLNRTEMICDHVALIAYTLHPTFKGIHMSNQQWNRVKLEIYKIGEQAYTELEKFLAGEDLFGDEDVLKLDPECYWKMIQHRYPSISKIALEFLPLLSTASLERVARGS